MRVMPVALVAVLIGAWLVAGSIAYAAGEPPRSDAARMMREGGGGGAPASGRQDQARQDGGGPRLHAFSDLLALLEQERDINLTVELEKYVRLKSFKPGEFIFQGAPGMPEETKGVGPTKNSSVPKAETKMVVTEVVRDGGPKTPGATPTTNGGKAGTANGATITAQVPARRST